MVYPLFHKSKGITCIFMSVNIMLSRTQNEKSVSSCNSKYTFNQEYTRGSIYHLIVTTLVLKLLFAYINTI